jgi:hypothetical protein
MNPVRVPLEALHLFPRPEVHQPYRVVGEGGEQRQLLVGRQDRSVGRAPVFGEATQLLAGIEVPEPQGLHVSGRG